MPCIGMIRGVGEGYNATEYILKIIRALNRRFRSKITVEIIKIGDCEKYGCDIDDLAIVRLRSCDAIFAGDIHSYANPLDYSICDVAMALDNMIEYNVISGLGDMGHVSVTIASYFDGGTKLRLNTVNEDGCSETRVCSTYTAMQIVKSVSRECENSRRRLSFVADSDNEYAAKLFLNKFRDFTMPLPNFKMINFNIEDITYEMLYDGAQFDVIFASKTFADFARGIYKSVLKDKFASYTRYAKSKSLYYVKSVCMNAAVCGEVASICSYILALSELLKRDFGMEKESEHLLRALENTQNAGISVYKTDEFVENVISELDKKLEKRHTKKVSKRIYLK